MKQKLLNPHVWGVVAACALGLALALVIEARAAVKDKEEAVTWDALPKAVRDTFEKEQPDKRPESIEKEKERGKMVYEAKYTLEKGTVEIEVREDGKLLEVEHGDDDDGPGAADDDDDDDDGEDDGE